VGDFHFDILRLEALTSCSKNASSSVFSPVPLPTRSNTALYSYKHRQPPNGNKVLLRSVQHRYCTLL